MEECPKCHCQVYNGECINKKCTYEINSQTVLEGRVNKYKEVKTMENDEKAIPEEIIDLGETGVIDLPKFDASAHIGKKLPIEKVSEHKGKFGYFVKFTTAPIEVGSEIRASRVVGLQEDKDGKIGWGEGTKMSLFLAKYAVAHYREMEGKEIIIQTTTGKDGNEYLSF